MASTYAIARLATFPSSAPVGGVYPDRPIRIDAIRNAPCEFGGKNPTPPTVANSEDG